MYKIHLNLKLHFVYEISFLFKGISPSLPRVKNNNIAATNKNDSAKSNSVDIKSFVLLFRRKAFNTKGLELNIACIIIEITIFPLEMLYTKVMINEKLIIMIAKTIIGLDVQVGIKNSGKCQPNHNTPKISEAENGLCIFNSLGNANPLQPGSSPKGPAAKKIM